MTVQIVPRKIRANYITSYDVCCVGFNYVLNFPTYNKAKLFCKEAGFDIYTCRSNAEAKKSRCRIFKNGRKIYDSDDRW